MAKTRVVVVDDSALVRSLLTEIINRQPDMECVHDVICCVDSTGSCP